MKKRTHTKLNNDISDQLLYLALIVTGIADKKINKRCYNNLTFMYWTFSKGHKFDNEDI